MNTIKTVRIVILLSSALLLMPAFGASKADLEMAMSYDGLQKLNVKGIDLVYARPGATLAGYSRVKLEPIEVSFHKDWDPTMSRSRI